MRRNLKRVLAAVTLCSTLFPTVARAQDVLAWPAPDQYRSDWRFTAKYLEKLLQPLLDAKTAYLQSALPPEDSTPPVWFAARYLVVPAKTADIHVFMKRDDVEVSDDAWLGDHGHMRRGSTYILITDRNGKPICGVIWADAASDWALLHGMIDKADYERQREQKKKGNVPKPQN